MHSPGSDLSVTVREGEEAACREFTQRLLALGFVRTKKKFWVRRRTFSADVIHLHRHGSYRGPISSQVAFQVHFAIKVFNDSFPAIALNGPESNTTVLRAGHYHLSFHAGTRHMYERCCDDLFRLVAELGQPWFGRFTSPAALTAEDSPLKETQRLELTLAMAGKSDPALVAQSLKLLGLKP